MADHQYSSSAGYLFHNLLAFRSEFNKKLDVNLFKYVNFCANNIFSSHAQILQDLFVLFSLASKVGGFFVEFGATDGIFLSNTLLLEQEFGWAGILCEPARRWQAELRARRKAIIDPRCVWDQTGSSLQFSETGDASLSTLSELVNKDYNSKNRNNITTYPVETVSLNDLLKQHNAPKQIDYLSIDTEGSEYRILQGFDFSAYDVKIITVEHNFCEPDRENIRKLLAAAGFMRVFKEISRFDDWYVKPGLPGLSSADALAAIPSVSRNAPCPCGSGRRYKHCHGAEA